jgi:carboxyl-terminal processing protease
MPMRKWVPTLVLVAFLAPHAALPQAKNSKSGVYEQLNLFGEAFERIRQDAVEPVGDRKLIETAISGMLASLDPNSV